MVSPPYKQGYPPTPLSYSGDGDRAIIFSLADLVGSPGAAESAQEGTLYQDTRTSTGWRLSPLNPPLTQYVGQSLLAAEADSGLTLWEQHLPGQSVLTSGLYLRSTTGAFSYIGPLTASGGPYQPIAASADYQHVVLSALGVLSEYSGTENKGPVLIGVNGKKGSTQPIGLCGIELGSGGSGSMYNSISGSGEVVFITVLPREPFGCEGPAPDDAEVYARIHGAPSSGLAAETVQVSASECTNVCGGASGKNFEGASEDGEKVFFTSTQKLTDNAVEGVASGNAAVGRGCAATKEGEGGCNLYEYSFAAQPGHHLKVVSTGGEVLGVAGIAENGARVYFVARNVLAAAGQNEYGKSPQGNLPNLYAYDSMSEKTSFIVTLSPADKRDWQRVFGRPAEVTGENGQFLLFASSTKALTPDDTSSLIELFEYDAKTAELVRITKGEDGYNADGNDALEGVEPLGLAIANKQLGRNSDFKSRTNRLNIAFDGRTVFFETGGLLSEKALSAAQGCKNVYEFHAAGTLSSGTVHLISDGRDTQLYKGTLCGAQFQAMDLSGRNALFLTADPLLSSDVDGYQEDIYDARVDGGFAPPVNPGSCSLGACEGVVSGGSRWLGPSSESEVGEAPVAPALSSVTSNKNGLSRNKGRALRLKRALKACSLKPKRRRSSCERAARRRLGSRQLGSMAKTEKAR